MSDVYARLRERIDELSTGFPATESKVELKILKRLFTEKEAELYIRLSPMLETPEAAAGRLNEDKDELAKMMEGMSRKGLLFRMKKAGPARYSIVPYVIGIFEHQINNITPEFAREMEDYFEAGFGKTIQSHKTPLMRTIPINKKLVTKWPIAPYEDAVKIMAEQEVITLAPCICRKTKNAVDEGCDKPVETCLIFGSLGKYYVDNNMGRFIEVDEAKEVLKKNDEAGLVIQPFNAKRVGGMCSCCGDCCGILRSLKMKKKPASAVQSSYFAEVTDECIGCEVCIERCQMDAIRMEEGLAVINGDRCIGCGLCVTTCDSEAMELVKKPDNELYEPPKSGADLYISLAMERKKNPMPE